MNPYVSIIVPVYNVEEYLKQCLDSVIGQTLENIEIILVNDGSTDSSGTICKEYAKKDKRICLVHQENRGLSAARNCGLELAKGEYIGFVDSDDWIESDMFEILYQTCLEENVKIACCKYRTIQNEKINIEKYSKKVEKLTSTQVMKDILNGKPGRGLCAWNKLYHRSVFEQNHLYFTEGRYYEDIDIMYKLVLGVDQIACIDLGLYNYRKNRQNSITSHKYGIQEHHRLKAYKGMYTYIKENVPVLYDDVRKACIYTYAVCVGRMIGAGVYDKKVYAKIQKKLRLNLLWVLKTEKSLFRKIAIFLCAIDYHVYKGAWIVYKSIYGVRHH